MNTALEDLEEKCIGLCDPDADGVINFMWHDRYEGIDVEVEDIFGNVVNCIFYKKDLVRTMKKLIKELKNENKNQYTK